MSKSPLEKSLKVSKRAGTIEGLSDSHCDMCNAKEVVAVFSIRETYEGTVGVCNSCLLLGKKVITARTDLDFADKAKELVEIMKGSEVPVEQIGESHLYTLALAVLKSGKFK